MTKRVFNPPPVPPWLLTFARDLREHMTDSELFLWRLLKRRQLGGFKFRQQHPVYGCIVDFYCCEAKLVVELDGGQHAETVQEDAARTAFLEGHGIKVVRVWDNDVFGNTQGVLEMIYCALVERVEAGRGGFPPP